MVDQRPLEKSVRRTIRRRLKQFSPDLKMIPYIAGNGGQAGTPDTLGSYKGRMVLIEAKRLGEGPSDIQKAQIKLWRLAGAAVLVTDNPDEAEEFIRSIDAGTV